ncbi:MAG: hypothetical protein ACI4A3_04730 [Lachnospiraceae bacterium]
MKRNLIFAAMALMIGILAGSFVYFYAYFYPKQYVKNDAGEYVNIATASNLSTFPVTKNTTFVIEYYYSDEQRILTEQAGNIPALLGCDKDGVIQYLEEYMKHLSKEEKEKGLVSYELVSYKGNQINLRKTFKKPVFSGYYAKSFNGMIVILNGDGKTVYEYTQIPINMLPDNVKEEVIEGYYLETEEDLYNFLENYSS